MRIDWDEAKRAGNYVFISHSRDDKRLIGKLGIVEYLATCNVHVAVDNADRGILPKDKHAREFVHQFAIGKNWEATIPDWATGAGCVLVLVSDAFFQRMRNRRGKFEWCIEELRCGASERKLLFVKIEDGLVIDSSLLNSQVPSSFLDRSEAGAITLGNTDPEGQLHKLYESVRLCIQETLGNRAVVRAGESNMITRQGIKALLSLIDRDEQSTVVRHSNLATYCDGESEHLHLAERLAHIELPWQSVSSRTSRRDWRKSAVMARELAAATRWFHFSESLEPTDGPEAFNERLRVYSLSKLLARAADESGIDITSAAVGGMLLSVEIEVDDRSWQAALDLAVRLANDFKGQSRADDRLRLLFAFYWRAGAWHPTAAHCTLTAKFLNAWQDFTARLPEGTKATKPLEPVARNDLREWCLLIGDCCRNVDVASASRHLDQIYGDNSPESRWWIFRKPKLRRHLTMRRLRAELQDPLSRWA